MYLKSSGERRMQTATPSVTLRERPDRAVFHIQVFVETETATAALSLLKRAALRMEELLQQAGQATLALTDFNLSTEAAKFDTATASLEATLTVVLPQDGSTWDRATKLAQVDDTVRIFAQEGKKQKPKFEVQRALPVFVLADPEVYREKLVQRLHERARSLSTGQPVQLRELKFDQPVQQRSLGLEHVELSLNIEGVAELLLSPSA